jgi:hypothetical protein
VATRETYTLFGYDEARRAGEKHAEAVKKAASDVRKNLPGIPCSETEVRRVLAANSHIVEPARSFVRGFEAGL